MFSRSTSSRSTRRRFLTALAALCTLPAARARAALNNLFRPDSRPIIKMTGTLKWYDLGKGYGFISADSRRPDALLHVAALRRSGVRMMLTGARIQFEALRTPNGLQCHRILAIDNTCASPVLGLPHTHVVVTPTSDWELAAVKWFNRLHGFAFLTRGEGTPDIFVHMETLRHCGIVDMRAADRFLLRHGHGPKGLMASEIKPFPSAGPAPIMEQGERIDR